MSHSEDRVALSGTSPWLRLEDYERAYHLDQYESPLGYATAFIDFLRRKTSIGDGSSWRVLDIGTGAGANLLWMSARFPCCTFTGIDINDELLAIAQERLANNDRIEVLRGNAVDLSALGDFDFVVSMQVLSWLDYDEAMHSIAEQCRCARHGVAATVVSTPRAADYLVEVRDHGAHKRKPVTIFSENTLDDAVREIGWTLSAAEPFALTADLPDDGMPRELHTRRTADGQNLTFAGEIYLPQNCILFERA
jgi:SAM-dependent methyltransferase